MASDRCLPWVANDKEHQRVTNLTSLHRPQALADVRLRLCVPHTDVLPAVGRTASHFSAHSSALL